MIALDPPRARRSVMKTGTAFHRIWRWRGWLAVALLALVAGCAGSQGDSSASIVEFQLAPVPGHQASDPSGATGPGTGHRGIPPGVRGADRHPGADSESSPGDLWKTLENRPEDAGPRGRVLRQSQPGRNPLPRRRTHPTGQRLSPDSQPYRQATTGGRTSSPSSGRPWRSTEPSSARPSWLEHWRCSYRKDLFQQYQVAVPRTLDELEAAARFSTGSR